MRKYIWMACLALALVAVAGLAHAHGGFLPSHGPASNVASSTDESPTCPLQWLMSFCHSSN